MANKTKAELEKELEELKAMVASLVGNKEEPVAEEEEEVVEQKPKKKKRNVTIYNSSCIHMFLMGRMSHEIPALGSVTVTRKEATAIFEKDTIMNWFMVGTLDVDDETFVEELELDRVENALSYKEVVEFFKNDYEKGIELFKSIPDQQKTNIHEYICRSIINKEVENYQLVMGIGKLIGADYAKMMNEYAD